MKNKIIIAMEGGIIHHIASNDTEMEVYIIDHDSKKYDDEYDPMDHFIEHGVDEELVIEPEEYIREAIEMSKEEFNTLKKNTA